MIIVGKKRLAQLMDNTRLVAHTLHIYNDMVHVVQSLSQSVMYVAFLGIIDPFEVIF